MRIVDVYIYIFNPIDLFHQFLNIYLQYEEDPVYHVAKLELIQIL